MDMGVCEMHKLLWKADVDLLDGAGICGVDGKGIASNVCDSAQPQWDLLTLF